MSKSHYRRHGDARPNYQIQPEDNMQEIVRKQAEEVKALVVELREDLEAISAPANVLKKVERLCELWGVEKPN